jgi:hypothetical protein
MLDIVIRAMTVGKVMLMLKGRGIMKLAKGSYWVLVRQSGTSLVQALVSLLCTVFTLVSGLHKITI